MTAHPNPRRRNGSRRTKLRKRVLAAYDVCWICGRPVDKTLQPGHPMSGEVDEAIPVSRGGNPFEWDNLRLAHRICNQRRGNHTIQWARANVQSPTAAMQETQRASSKANTSSEW